jgi:serine/threonine-protein kinase
VTGLTHQSAAGLIKGTYGYMAPEQVRGDAVTTRADVYGAGIVLWEMLAHKRAFHRGALPEIEVLRAMEEPRIPSIDSVRPDLDKNVRAALKRALEPSADRRTITAEEMVSVLRAVVPSDQGRERLASALALVRHEPKPKPTSAPPPPEATPIAPRPGAARPTTAAYGSPPKPSSGHIPAAPPVPRVEPPRRPSSGRMRAAPPLPPRAGAPKPPPPPRATSTERSFPAVVAPRPPTLAGVDTDDEERPMVVPEREALETPRGIGPSAEGLGLGAAIDEILQDMPSSAPARPVDVEIAASEASARAKALGDLPPSPPPLKATLPGAEPSPPPPDTSPDGVEGRIEHTLVMRSPSGGQEAPTVRPPPELIQETTAMMRRIDVAAGPHRGAAPGNDADTARPPPPPPVGGTAPLAQPVSSGGGATAPLATPIAPTTGPSGDLGPPPESYGLPGARPLGPTIAISFAVVALVAACVIGVVTYVRWKEASTEAPIALPAATNAPAPSVASARPSSTAKVAPPSAASAVASVAASASVAPGASETPAASAAASASASAPSTPTLADLPAGSGLVKTEGAPPGRRIFVDDRTVGQTPESVVVKCGTHQIKIGSAGTARAVDVPCGGEIVVH